MIWRGALKKRPFGGTGHDVTPIGLGTVALGRSPRVKSDAQAVEIVRAAFEAGVNFIDTAPLYGVAEHRLGVALKNLSGEVPDDLVINTKAGYRPDPFDYSEQQTIACVERSLDLLGLDFIHYVHIHDVERAEIATVLDGALKGLQKLKQQKVVGHIGVAGGPVDLLTEYVETGEFESVITHNRFNLLDRPATALINRASELGMAVVNAAPFASGILAPAGEPRHSVRLSSGSAGSDGPGRAHSGDLQRLRRWGSGRRGKVFDEKRRRGGYDSGSGVSG